MSFHFGKKESMPLVRSPLLWSVRGVAALGLSALTLTGEIGVGYLAAAWCLWILSWVIDRFPQQQEKLRRYETSIVVVIIAAFLFDFFMKQNTLFISLSHFLLLFQMLKLAGRKTRSDAMQIFLFGFFQLLAACTLSVNVWHAIILLLLIPNATAALFWNYVEQESEKAHQPVPQTALRPFRRLTLGMCLSAVPINLALTLSVFILFPRLKLNVSMPGFDTGRSGYIDQVNLLQSGNLSNDNSTVLWLAFPSEQDHQAWNGYLRGTTLDLFDGRQWSSSKAGSSTPFLADSNGVFTLSRPSSGFKPLHQMITLINTSGSTLFAAGLPVQVVAPLQIVQREMSGCLHWNSAWRRPLRYQVLSDVQTPLPLLGGGWPQARRGSAGNQSPLPYPSPEKGEGTTGNEELLQIPNIPITRIQALTRSITGRSSDAPAALAIENYLRTHMQYSTEMGTSGSSNPVEDFLFVKRRGPCGPFASAMALMLRVQGIPSRVVAGYYKGEWNEPAGQVLIRERDAHAWVEAWIAGKGWMTFDPTPRGTLGGAESHAWHSFQQYWDYLGFKWDKLVVEYDLYAQIKALESVRDTSEKVNNRIAQWWWKRTGGKTQPSPGSKHRRWIRPLCWALILPLFFLVFTLRHRSGSLCEDTAVRRYRGILQQFARKGMPKKLSETGWEFARRVIARWPDQSSIVMPVTGNYYQARFASPEQEGTIS